MFTNVLIRRPTLTCQSTRLQLPVNLTMEIHKLILTGSILWYHRETLVSNFTICTSTLTNRYLRLNNLTRAKIPQEPCLLIWLQQLQRQRRLLLQRQQIELHLVLMEEELDLTVSYSFPQLLAVAVVASAESLR